MVVVCLFVFVFSGDGFSGNKTTALKTTSVVAVTYTRTMYKKVQQSMKWTNQLRPLLCYCRDFDDALNKQARALRDHHGWRMQTVTPASCMCARDAFTPPVSPSSHPVTIRRDMQRHSLCVSESNRVVPLFLRA